MAATWVAFKSAIWAVVVFIHELPHRVILSLLMKATGQPEFRPQYLAADRDKIKAIVEPQNEANDHSHGSLKTSTQTTDSTEEDSVALVCGVCEDPLFFKDDYWEAWENPILMHCCGGFVGEGCIARHLYSLERPTCNKTCPLCGKELACKTYKWLLLWLRASEAHDDQIGKLASNLDQADDDLQKLRSCLLWAFPAALVVAFGLLYL